MFVVRITYYTGGQLTFKSENTYYQRQKAKLVELFKLCTYVSHSSLKMAQDKKMSQLYTMTLQSKFSTTFTVSDEAKVKTILLRAF